MDALHIEHIPPLRRPYFLMTFDGWSNAAGVATAAGKFLVQHLQAERLPGSNPRRSLALPTSGPSRATMSKESARSSGQPTSSLLVGNPRLSMTLSSLSVLSRISNGGRLP